MSASYYLTTMVDNCVLRRQLGIAVSFPGLPQLQFLIVCSILQAIKNWSRGRPGNEARPFLSLRRFARLGNSMVATWPDRSSLSAKGMAWIPICTYMTNTRIWHGVELQVIVTSCAIPSFKANWVMRKTTPPVNTHAKSATELSNDSVATAWQCTPY